MNVKQEVKYYLASKLNVCLQPVCLLCSKSKDVLGVMFVI